MKEGERQRDRYTKLTSEEGREEVCNLEHHLTACVLSQVKYRGCIVN